MKYFSIIVCMVFMTLSCREMSPVDSMTAEAKNGSARAAGEYKEIMAGYYRTGADKADHPEKLTTMLDLPTDLDMVMIFQVNTSSTSNYWNVLRDTYVPELHKRGTKVIYTVGGINMGPEYTHNTAGYEKYAKHLIDNYLIKYNADGLDFDIEDSPSGQTLTDKVGIVTALSKYVGPKSGTGKLLIYDTNQDGTTPFFQAIYDKIDYVFLQAYGRSATSVNSTYNNTYASKLPLNKFLPGFSFHEERGDFHDVHSPDDQKGIAYDYAKWNLGKKGGIFAYAIDRDIPDQQTDTSPAPDYKVTKNLIDILHGNGVQFYRDYYYGGPVSTYLKKGTYTGYQLTVAGVPNDWASSVKIPVGWKVTMYADDNFTGQSWVLTANKSSFGSLSPSANDKITSVKIE
ncbi:endo-beta-N-acetylglucosaminidase [Spirosoma aureum]|uniref:mannosyl-glycoprotein endo-beta-N-acetylglucosaminidase n=1 Tax=Spirosoma aureum TaxID=2692134 RepID=A0A6G9AJH4_9BACT|nr:endo-beta-N-acetylglucosaminidase [Spirosoma aureum]QIP12425.1 endo-beta-N-acetylglucosaminidase [Spirosoma aureum]